MAAPLLTLEQNLDARAFTLMHLAAQPHNQCLDVCEDNRRRGGLGKNRLKDFSLFGVHRQMLAKIAITRKH